MQRHSIQSVLDWLSFKGLLNNPNQARAKLLVDLNIQNNLMNQSKTTLMRLSCAGVITILLLLALSQVPHQHQIIVFMSFTLLIAVLSLFQQQSRFVETCVLGCLTAICFETCYIMLSNQLPLTIFLHSQVVWVFNALLYCAIIAHLYLLARDKHFFASHYFLGICAFLITLMALIHPTLLIASLILILGYRMVHYLMIAFALLMLAGLSVWLLYQWPLALNLKALFMLGTGLILFTVYRYGQQKDLASEG